MFWLVLLLSINSTGLSHLAYACSCAPPPPPEEALALADAVFSGEVVELREEKSEDDKEIKFIITVLEQWKGDLGKSIVMNYGGTTCSYGFKKGDRYLIFAFKSEFKGVTVFHTNICTRTKPLTSAQDDLNALGKAKSPSDK